MARNAGRPPAPERPSMGVGSSRGAMAGGKVPSIRGERPSVGVGSRIGQVTSGRVPGATDTRRMGVSEVGGMGAARPTNAKPQNWDAMSPEDRGSAVEEMRQAADDATPKPW
jgi:hypothetical protein